MRAWTRGMAGGVLNLRFGDESRVAVRWFFTVKTLEPEKNDQISVEKNHGGNNAPRIQSTKYPVGCWLLQKNPRQTSLEGCRCVQLAALTFPHLAGPTLVPSLLIGSS